MPISSAAGPVQSTARPGSAFINLHARLNDVSFLSQRGESAGGINAGLEILNQAGNSRYVKKYILCLVGKSSLLGICVK
ncbi:hypothetical protein DESC_610238 [Desulfosarcina cetonica]|nr:hypothetical protein DESC_610238 [Desulfosarcina cetonica]